MDCLPAGEPGGRPAQEALSRQGSLYTRFSKKDGIDLGKLRATALAQARVYLKSEESENEEAVMTGARSAICGWGSSTKTLSPVARPSLIREET